MVNDTNSANAKEAQEHWGREADEEIRYGKGFHWVESPIVMSYLNEQITGDPNVDWLAYSYQKYLRGKNPLVTRILSLGCGGGALERRLCQMGFHNQIEACDFSDEALEHARAMAAREKIENIRYFNIDLNHARFPGETYDIIFSGSALHHISNLEHLLDQLQEALVEDGLLIINEYVGPFKLQWTPQQTKIIDELLHLLPQKYRKRVSATSQFKDYFLGPASIPEMDAIDPTESVRSDEIVPLIRARFSIREQRNFGGTLLHMLLQDIVGNFNATDPVDAGFLQLLIYIERVLIREHVLASDFTFLVAEKNGRLAHSAHKDYPIQSAYKMLHQSDEYSRAVETRVHELEGRLTSISTNEGSAAWQAVLLFRQWKERRLPIGTRRRKVYDALIGRVRRRLTARHETS
jgi:SAM-dependent methyltransferase